MNKKLLGLFFLVVLAGLFFFTYEREKPNLPSPKFVEITEEKAFTKPRKILDLAKDRPSKKLKIQDKTSPCHEIINLFSNISFAEIKESAKDIIAFGSKASCRKQIETALKDTVIGSMREKCLGSVDALNSKKCVNFLTNFRAWAINLNYPDDDLDALDDTVLINKFLWNFTNNPEFKLEKLDKGLEYINELISKRPDFYAAYKAKLIPLFLKVTQHKQNLDIELSSTLDALNSLGGDEQVAEFPIVLNLNKKDIDEEKTKAHIDNYLKEYPDSSRGLYYLAALEWKKQKNLDNTKRLLKQALKKNPKDQFIRDTLNSTKSGKPVFYFSIDFNMGNL